MNRVTTGVPGLDMVLKGGLIKNHVILVSGRPGSGKSTLGMQFLLEGCRNGEAGLLITFEQEADEIRKDADGYGWDLKAFEKKGLLKIVRFRPYKVEDWDKLLYENVKLIKEASSKGVKRIVIDNFSTAGLFISNSRDIKLLLYDIIDLYKRVGATTLLLSEIDDSGTGKLSKFGIEEYVVDGILFLGLVTSEDSFKRSLVVEKMRRSSFLEGYHELEITEHGLTVIPNLGGN